MEEGSYTRVIYKPVAMTPCFRTLKIMDTNMLIAL